jgi:hypothetical protein
MDDLLHDVGAANDKDSSEWPCAERRVRGNHHVCVRDCHNELYGLAVNSAFGRSTCLREAGSRIDTCIVGEVFVTQAGLSGDVMSGRVFDGHE